MSLALFDVFPTAGLLELTSEFDRNVIIDLYVCVNVKMWRIYVLAYKWKIF